MLSAKTRFRDALRSGGSIGDALEAMTTDAFPATSNTMTMYHHNSADPASKSFKQVKTKAHAHASYLRDAGHTGVKVTTSHTNPVGANGGIDVHGKWTVHHGQAPVATDAAFNESDHPRDKGKFSTTARKVHPHVGRSVKMYTEKHKGQTGTITAVRKEPTFSQMVPHKTVHSIKLDSGELISARKDHHHFKINDAAFNVVEPYNTVGQGKPLDRRLFCQDVRDAAKDGGEAHEVLGRVFDKRLTFTGSARDIYGGVDLEKHTAVQSENLNKPMSASGKMPRVRIAE